MKAVAVWQRVLPLLASTLAVTVVSCGDEGDERSNDSTDDVDPVVPPDDDDPPPVELPETVRFDPMAGVLPVPNNGPLDPETGLLSLPARCGETDEERELRENVLSQLTGYGVWKLPLVATFTSPVDVDSVTGRVLLVRASFRGTAIPATAEPPVLTFATAGPIVDYDADCDSKVVDALTVTPVVSLAGESKYYVVLLSGITNADGEAFQPSPVWELLRREAAPVVVEESATGPVVTHNDTELDPDDPDELAQLVKISALWQQHAPMLDYLDDALALREAARENVLVAWELDTVAVRPWLSVGDAATAVALAPTATPNGLTVTTAVTDPLEITATLEAALDPGGTLAAEGGACAALGLACADVGAIVRGTFVAPDYQVPGPDGVPGRWTDPLHPEKQADAAREVLAFVAAPSAVPMPWRGRPVVVFAHDFDGSKEALFGLATELAEAGLSSIALDLVGHGTRAVRTSTDAARGCDGAVSQRSAPQCFAPVFAADPATTRDNLRQSVADVYKLTHVLRACGRDGAACGGLAVDGTRIAIVGHGLGGLVAGTLLSEDLGIRAGVLNASGVSLVDIVTDTAQASIKCQYVDALIDAGTLTGPKWGTAEWPTCVGYEWVQTPAFQRLAATVRWIIDPADPANFVPYLTLGKNRAFVQQIKPNLVVPDWTAETLAMEMSLTAVPASTAAEVVPSGEPGTGATTSGSAWVVYEDDAASGRYYRHGSILLSAGAADFALGTAQVQLDAVEYLRANL